VVFENCCNLVLQVIVSVLTEKYTFCIQVCLEEGT